MWITAKECVGLKGFPSAEKNIRTKLDRFTEQNPEWRRKRKGTKAFEYYIECLPPEAQQAFRAQQALLIMADASVPA
ncbi:MAG: DNA-binding protein, partial [Plesiomonas sp.]|uniref:DNA-binding protein n=1 Tax=Plesiomonas sp. TaxID=2486279 RepID=UPI003F3B3656